MPYIPKSRREKLADVSVVPLTAGELNYVISKLIDNYINDIGPSYQNFNDIIGMLECCKLEVYRRIVSPHEEKKLKENGEVFDCISLIK